MIIGAAVAGALFLGVSVWAILSIKPEKPPIAIQRLNLGKSVLIEDILEATKAELDRTRRIHGLDIGNYNIAIVGQSGSGKSSLVNGLCKRKDDEIGAAEVGDEKETTLKVQGYKHKDYPRVVFWDVPGGGTKSHPTRTYFEDLTLIAFDALVLVTAGRSLEGEKDIFDKAQDAGIPIFVVRTKVDYALEQKKKRTSRVIQNEQQMYEELRRVVKEDVGAQIRGQKVYMVSAPNFMETTNSQFEETVFQNELYRSVTKPRFNNVY